MEEMIKQAKEYSHALLYMLSEIVLTETSSLDEVDWSQCTEARFFSADKELHLIFGEDPLSIVVCDSDYEDFIVREYRLAQKYAALGRKLVVKHYLDQDEDGQNRIVMTRLAGIK